MTTPAGWYDDGSGRLRWWDGEQWTEHFAPAAEPEAPATEENAFGAESAGSSDGAASSESAASSENVAPSESIAPSESGAPSGSAVAYENTSSEPSTHGAGADGSASFPQEQAQVPFSADQAAPESAAPWSEQPAAAPWSEQPTQAFDAQPAYTAPGASEVPSHDSPVPPYGDAPPTYPGAAPTPPYPPQTHGGASPDQGYPGAQPNYAPQAPAYPGGAQSYPAAGAYPTGYTGAPTSTEPKRISVVGIVGLALAGLGTILSCIPVTAIFGWILLAAGFIVSLISLFLKGKKWPGIAGLILSVVGTIIAVVMAVVFVAASWADAVDDLPSAPPSSSTDGTDGGTDEGDTGGDAGTGEVAEGSLGDPVTVTQMSGVGEVTIKSATWSTTDGTDIPSTNGGFVVLDVAWAGTEGTTFVNPLYFEIETADGTAGSYDFFADDQLESAELEAGQSLEGKITFDVAQSESYTVIITDELLSEVARITVAPAAG